jgi:hypothetical protein
MKPVFFAALAILIVLTADSLARQQPEGRGRTGPIAISGGAELETIRIVRWKASYAAGEADLTNMEIALWLPGKWKPKSTYYLVRILELKPIEDETGKVLTTNERLRSIPYLRAEVAVNGSRSFQGKEGPVIEFRLEAPARQATKIKSIKGKAEVSTATITPLRFDDVSAMRGQALPHPKLRDLPIRPRIEVEDGMTRITLGMPDRYARVHNWWLEKCGERLPLSIEGPIVIDGKFIRGKEYQGERTKDYSLKILLAEPVQTKVFEFEFKDLELP